MATSQTLACALMLFMLLLGAPTMEAAITCAQVTTKLAPCIGYLRSSGTVTPACCTGIKTLISSARTTPDRQQACNCLKQAAGAAKGINPTNAANLPSRCRVNIPYRISMSTNCNTVK